MPWGGAGTSDPRPGSVLLSLGSCEWNLGYSQLLALLRKGDARGAGRDRGFLGGCSRVPAWLLASFLASFLPSFSLRLRLSRFPVGHHLPFAAHHAPGGAGIHCWSSLTPRLRGLPRGRAVESSQLGLGGGSPGPPFPKPAPHSVPHQIPIEEWVSKSPLLLLDLPFPSGAPGALGTGKGRSFPLLPLGEGPGARDVTVGNWSPGCTG